MSQLSMFSAEELPASHSASPVTEADWMMLVATSCSPLAVLLADIAPAGWSGRTCPASFRATRDETLEAFWRCSPDGLSKSLQADGNHSASFRAGRADTASHGECLTLSISEWPSDAVVCSLSDILETGDVPPQYFLSERACAGILRRAEKRGKKLPRALQEALEAVAPNWQTMELPPDEETEDQTELPLE
jgi:hypothetical protein